MGINPKRNDRPNENPTERRQENSEGIKNTCCGEKMDLPDSSIVYPVKNPNHL